MNFIKKYILKFQKLRFRIITSYKRLTDEDFRIFENFEKQINLKEIKDPKKVQFLRDIMLSENGYLNHELQHRLKQEKILNDLRKKSDMVTLTGRIRLGNKSYNIGFVKNQMMVSEENFNGIKIWKKISDQFIDNKIMPHSDKLESLQFDLYHDDIHIDEINPEGHFNVLQMKNEFESLKKDIYNAIEYKPLTNKDLEFPEQSINKPLKLQDGTNVVLKSVDEDIYVFKDIDSDTHIYRHKNELYQDHVKSVAKLSDGIYLGMEDDKMRIGITMEEKKEAKLSVDDHNKIQSIESSIKLIEKLLADNPNLEKNKIDRHLDKISQLNTEIEGLKNPPINQNDTTIKKTVWVTVKEFKTNTAYKAHPSYNEGLLNLTTGNFNTLKESNLKNENMPVKLYMNNNTKDYVMINNKGLEIKLTKQTLFSLYHENPHSKTLKHIVEKEQEKKKNNHIKL